VRKEVKHNNSSIIVWGYINILGIGHIICIKGNIDGAFYTQILNNDVLGTLKDLGINKKNVYFQQNSDLKHTSKITQNWFKKAKLNVLDWAPSSPDINIIKHAWDYLDKRVCDTNMAACGRCDWKGVEEKWL